MTVRRLLVASAVALTAGVAGVLAITAAADAWGTPGAAVLVALVAVWVGQAIPPLIRAHRRSAR